MTAELEVELEPQVEVVPDLVPLTAPEPLIDLVPEVVEKPRLRDRLGRTRAAFSGVFTGMRGHKIDDATFAPLGPVDAKIALVAGSIDAWAVWEPYVSYATLKDNARVIANGEGLTPTVTFIVASDSAIATKRAAVQDLVQRLNKARLWSLDHLPEYAKNTAELTRLPEDVLLSAYKAQHTSPIAIDESIVREVQEASDRATRYGILTKTLDVNKAVDRSFTAAANSN